MSDDDIVQQRVSGRCAREIAKTGRRSVAQVNEAIDRSLGGVGDR